MFRFGSRPPARRRRDDRPAEGDRVHLAYTDEQEALQQELRAYFAELMTPEVEAEVGVGETRRPGLPRGGAQDRARRLARHRLAEGVRRAGLGPTSSSSSSSNESWRAGAPMPFLTHQHRRPDDHGVRHRRSRRTSSCRRSCAGELHFSIGYTEPGAGTDLASLDHTAVKDGDEWVINGQKIYTSLASYADYIWLAARTDPDAPKHQGHHDLRRAHHRPGLLATRRSTRW